MGDIYIGNNGVARKVEKVYIGVNGIARQVQKIYVGVNGIAREVYSSGLKPILLGTFTGPQSIDVSALGETTVDDYVIEPIVMSDTSLLGNKYQLSYNTNFYPNTSTLRTYFRCSIYRGGSYVDDVEFTYKVYYMPNKAQRLLRTGGDIRHNIPSANYTFGLATNYQEFESSAIWYPWIEIYKTDTRCNISVAKQYGANSEWLGDATINMYSLT